MAEQEIKRIDLSQFQRTKFVVDLGDGEAELRLNVNDVGIIERITTGIAELERLHNLLGSVRDIKMPTIEDIEDEVSLEDIKQIDEALSKIATTLEEVDSGMKKTIDYIFDSNVSEVCCPYGHMYDPVNGVFKYELIMETLLTLYTDAIQKESAKIAKRKNQHTAKYTKKHK